MLQLLLLFGPCHGRSWEIRDDPQREIDVPENGGGPMWDYSNGYPDISRPQIHRYRFYESFSSDNMEDCLLYIHHEQCCDATLHSASSRQRISVRPEPQRVYRIRDRRSGDIF